MWYYFAFLLLVGRSFSHSLPYFFMLLDIHVLILCIAPDGLVVKGKAEAKRERMSSKKWERERANDVSWTFAHTYVLQKKAFASLFIRLSSFLVFASFFLALFFRLSPVLLSYSSSSLSLFVDIRTAMFFVCSMPFTLPCVWVMEKERERDDEGATQWCEMLICMYVCARARADRLYFLSIYDDDEDVENARARAAVAVLLWIDPSFLPSPPFFSSCLMLRFFRLAS
jgi:hypothetical protein